MIIADIALFKRFLHANGVNTLFKGLYSQFRFPENPENVEDYLIQVEVRQVILMAFKFPAAMDSFRHGTEFWTEMAIKWDNLLTKMKNDGYYSDRPRAIARYEEEAAIPIDKFKKNLTDVIKFNWKEDEKTSKKDIIPEEEGHNTPRPTQQTAPSSKDCNSLQLSRSKGLGPTGTFKLFDLKKNVSNKMKENQISVSNKKGNYKITFNKKATELINSHHVTNFQIGQDEVTGEVRILFGNFEKGLPFSITKAVNLTISNKNLVEILADIFDIKETLATLYISKNMAAKADYVVFIITKDEQ